MTVANQMPPMPTVSRSRLRSAIEEPPSELETPPPNMSERPPPRPLCSSTSRIIRELVRTRMMVRNVSTVAKPTSRVRRSQDRHVVEPADPAEFLGLQARAPHQGTVDVDVEGVYRLR